MIQAEADKSRQLLTIRFAQRVGPDETKRHAERLQTLLGDLQPGFRLLADLSRLETMDMACVTDIARTMDLCNRKGVATVVRVLPDPSKDIGLNILSLFHYSHGVQILTCDTMDQAASALSLPQETSQRGSAGTSER